MLVYDKIKEICAQKKISVSSVERSAGLSNGSISKWNESSPTLRNLRQVADYLDVPLEVLIKE